MAEEAILIPVENAELTTDLVSFLAEAKEKAHRILLLLPDSAESNALIWTSLLAVDGVCFTDKVDTDSINSIHADFYAIPPGSSIVLENNDRLITIDGQA